MDKYPLSKGYSEKYKCSNINLNLKTAEKHNRNYWLTGKEMRKENV